MANKAPARPDRLLTKNEDSSFVPPDVVADEARAHLVLLDCLENAAKR